MRRFSRTILLVRVQLAALALLACAALAAPPSAHAFTVESKPFATTGTIGLQPDRKELQIAAGRQATFPVVVLNRTGRALQFSLRVIDAGAGNDSASFLLPQPQSRFGAAQWVTLDRAQPFVLQQGQQATLVATVSVPAGEGPGARYALVEVSTQVPRAGGGGTGVALPAALQAQVVVTVAGAIRAAGHIERVRAPRWADEAGQSFVPVEATWENDGNATDTVSGEVRIRSIFGNVAATMPLERLLVARGGERTWRVTWHDTPFLGVFRPTVEMRGSNGEVDTRRGRYVFVSPPWYYLAVVAGALLLPLIVRIVSRRREQTAAHEEEGADHDGAWHDPDASPL